MRIHDVLVPRVVTDEVGRAVHREKKVRVGVADPGDLRPGTGDRDRTGGRGGAPRAHRLPGALPEMRTRRCIVKVDDRLR